MTIEQIESGWWSGRIFRYWPNQGGRASQTAVLDKAEVGQNTILYGYGLLTCLALSPLLFATLPPLVDLPNHVARIHILANYGQDADLQNNYLTTWRPRTYLLPDLLCVGLAKILPIYLVGRLYVAAAITALAAATFWLSKQLVGRPSIWVFAALLFLFNLPLAWGFINFLLGTALALLAFGVWLKHDGKPRWSTSVWMTILALATYFTHIVAVALLGLLMLAHQIQFYVDKHGFSWRAFMVRWAHIGLYFVVPTSLFWLEDAGETVRSGATIYGDAASKLRALLSPTLLSGGAIELCTWVFVAATFGLLAVRKSLRISRSAHIPLILLVIVALAMPLRLSGVFGLDFRLPVVVCLLLVAGIQDVKVSPRWQQALIACGLTLFLTRTYTVANAWHIWDQQIQELREGLTTVERGARVLSVGTVYPSHFHINALAAIDRSAFVPTLFTGATMLRAAESTQKIDTPSGVPLPLIQLRDPAPEALDGYHCFYWDDWEHDFDYVIWFYPRETTNHPWGKLMFRGSYFAIHEIGPVTNEAVTAMLTDTHGNRDS